VERGLLLFVGLRMRAGFLSLAAAVAASCVAAALGQQSGSRRNVLTVDCHGGVHLFSGTSLEVNLNLEAFLPLVQTAAESFKDNARCACPLASDEELMRRFVPSLNMLLARSVHNFDGDKWKLDDLTKINSCVSSAVAPPSSVFAAVFQAEYLMEGVGVPDSCSYSSFLNGEGCAFSILGDVNNTYLKDSGSQFNVFMDMCPGQDIWPFISVECQGNGCNSYFLQPCFDDFGCTQGKDVFQTCKPFFGSSTTEFRDYFVENITFSAGGGTCSSQEDQEFADDILNLIGHPTMFPFTDLKTCGVSFFEIVEGFATVVHNAGFSLQEVTNFLFDDSEEFTRNLQEQTEDSSGDGIFDLGIDPPFEAVQVLRDVPVSEATITPPGDFQPGTCALRGCHISNIGDGYCNPACNIAACAFDGNDCNNCECLQGDDFSNCATGYFGGSSFFQPNIYSAFTRLDQGTLIVPPDFFASVNPEDREACAIRDAVEPTISVYDTSNACTSVEPDSSGPRWFCTYGAYQLMDGKPLNNTFLVSDLIDNFDCSGEYRNTPRTRACFCLEPPVIQSGCLMDPNLPFDVLNSTIYNPLLEFEGNCGDPPPLECPAAVLKTSTSNLLVAHNVDTSIVDKDGISLPTPVIQPQPNNILYTTCAGDIVLNLFNPTLRIGLSLPKMGSNLAILRRALDSLDRCLSVIPASTLEDKEFGFYFWRLGFFRHLFAPQSELDAITNRDQSRFDFGSFLRNSTNTVVEFPNVPGLSLANLQGASGSGSGPQTPVKVRLDTLKDLFNVEELFLQAEINSCSAPSEELFRGSLALTSPELSQFFTDSRACSDIVTDTCSDKGASICVDLVDVVTGLVANISDIDRAFDSLVWQRSIPPPNACLNLGNRGVLLDLRKFVLGYFLDIDEARFLGANVPALTFDLLLTCAPELFGVLPTLFRDGDYSCVSGEISCSGSSLQECESQFSFNQSVCDWNGFSEITEANLPCGSNLVQEPQCDYALCITYDTTTSIVRDRYEGGFAIDSFGQFVARNPLNDCLDSCSSVYGSGSFCQYRAQCNDIGPMCSENANLRFPGQQETINQPDGGECPESLPYAWGVSTKYCCGSDNGIAEALRAVTDAPVDCQNSTIGVQCLGLCTDYTLPSLVIPGSCLKPVGRVCESQNVYRQDLSNATTSFSQTYDQFPNNLAGCQLDCAIIRTVDLDIISCTCTAVQESTCSSEYVPANCEEVSVPGEGLLWVQNQITEIDSGDDFIIFANTLLPETGPVPGPVFTADPPVLVNANFSSDGTTIQMLFDRDTNEGLGSVAGATGPCLNVVRVPGQENLQSVCYWVSARKLVISVNPLSTIQLGVTVSLVAGNNIRADPSVGFSPEASGSVSVSGDQLPTDLGPVVSLEGAVEQSICAGEVYFTANVLAFAIGRVVNFDFSISPQGSQDPIYTASQTGSLFIVKASEVAGGQLDGGDYVAALDGTNWLGFGSSETFTFNFTVSSQEVPTILIDGARIRTVRRGVDELALRATTTYVCPNRQLTDTFLYTWSAKSPSAGIFTPFVSDRVDSFLRLGKQFFAEPGLWELEVRVRLESDGSIDAVDRIAVNVTNAPLVIATRAGNVIASFSNEPLRVDFTPSCDPNLGAGCRLVYGAVPGSPAFNNLGFQGATWDCTGTRCNDITPISGPILNVLNPPVGLYVFTLSIGGQTSPPIRREVLPAPIGCNVIPRVSIAPVQPRLSLKDGGIILRGQVENYVPQSSNPVRLQWTFSRGGAPFESATVVTPVANRPELVIAKDRLAPGESYVFRLTATQPCTAPPNVHPFAEVSFTVNAPPSGGILSTDRLSGIASETIFTFSTSGWIDEDTPLQYSFEYTFAPPMGLVDGVQTFKLSPFSASSTLRTSLELPPSARELSGSALVYVTASARDLFGAESRRINFLPINITNPIDSPAWVPPELSIELQEATSTGGESEDLLRTILRIASLANAAGAAISASLEEWAARTRDECLGRLLLLTEELRERNDPFLLTLQSNVILTLLGSPEQIPPELQNRTITFLFGLIEQATVLSTDLDDLDPELISIVPPQLQTSVLESLTALLAAVRSTLQTSVSSRRSLRRRLQEEAQACDVVDLTREAIEKLALIALQRYAEGAGARQFQSSGIQYSAAKESSRALGSGSAGGDGLAEIGIPPPLDGTNKNGQGASEERLSKSDSGSFVLPANLLSGFNFGENGISIDLVAVSWNYDIRCEAVVDITLLSADGEDCSSFDDIETLTYAGPITEITDIVSLDLFEDGNRDQRYDPTGLDETITIRIPRNPFLNISTGLCGETNYTEIACGFFNETIGDWSTGGCQLAQNQSDPDFVICECTHMSDYATWQAFTEDVRNTFSNPITGVTFVAILVLAIMFPTLVGVWFLGMYWASKRDSVDAEEIQKGAIGMMYLRRLQNRAKQKQFFDNLKSMTKPVNELESYKALKSEAANGKKRRGNIFGRNLCYNFYLALRYEHSVLGLVRFDPHYSRAQRVSVFLAIVVGNLLAAAIFFELKTASEVTAGFVLGTVLLSSLFVSIPVRILVKTLFRTTANKTGSKYDRVSNVFKIAARLNESAEANTEAVDIELLNAYRQLYAAKRSLDAAKNALREAKHQAEREGFGRRRKSSAPGKKSSAVGTETVGVPADISAFANSAHAEKLEQLKAELEQAQSEYSDTKRHVTLKGQEAQRAWKDVPTADAIKRINRVKRQKSALMKASALLADEANSVGKPRRAYCSYYMTYIAWVILFAFYGVAIYYITKFVISRADLVGEGEEEKLIIFLWLLTAALGITLGYLVAEPMVFFIRYALLPYLVIRCGNASDDDDDAAEEEGDILDEEERKKQRKSLADKHRSASSAKDKYLYEKNKEATKKDTSGRDQIFWEIASDLLEAGF